MVGVNVVRCTFTFDINIFAGMLYIECLHYYISYYSNNIINKIINKIILKIINMYDENGRFYLSSKDKATLLKCIYNNPYIPYKPFPKQAEMILANEKEVLVGGSAGGSKSTSMLMRSLMYIQDEENQYDAIILRRSLSDLKRKGGLISIASRWLNRKEIQNNKELKPKWNGTDHVWNFPSGNSLSFGYLRNVQDLDTYQGSEYQFIAIDELTQMERFKYIYMRSRVRKAKSNKLPTQIFSASNPGNRGNKWVRERFIEHKDENVDYNEVRFIPSSYRDNIYLDRKEYEEFLLGLDRIQREQLMNGNWYTRIKGQLFDETDFNIISYKEFKKIPIVYRTRYWDLAATEVIDEEKKKGSDPDYTAGVKIDEDIEGNLYITDVKKFQLESRKLIDEVINTAVRDDTNIQYVEIDASTGKNFCLLLLDEMQRIGLKTGKGNSRENKVDRARRVSAILQKEGIYLVGKKDNGMIENWAMEFIEEMTSYPNEAVHDDAVVAFSGAYEKIKNRKGIGKIDADKWLL